MDKRTVLVRTAWIVGLVITCMVLPSAVLAAQAAQGQTDFPEQDMRPGEQSSEANWFVPYVAEGLFSCDIPAEWSLEESLEGPATAVSKVYRIVLSRPMPEEMPIRIALGYFAEGNTEFATMDQFIATHSQPILGSTPEEGKPPVAEIIVSGRTATVFTQHRNEFVPMQGIFDAAVLDDGRVYENREMMARQVPMEERFVLLPAGEGFYVLSYDAPTSVFQQFLGTFERVMSTVNAMR
ncbi:MAG: hypothetical protein KKB70_06615 [Proteobacteria bacterium]|nr:hypothetical protein [Pseudomonadota bacterium]MBU1611713.1 hypothetical protein [Pseudomonadota bacterium]